MRFGILIVLLSFIEYASDHAFIEEMIGLQHLFLIMALFLALSKDVIELIKS